MLNKYVDPLIINVETDDIDRVTAELKMRIWDRAIKLSKERNVDLSEDLIAEVAESIANVEDFLYDLEPSLHDWYLNKIAEEGICCKCGLCATVCPNDYITFLNKPLLHVNCNKHGEGLCKELCPRISSESYQIKSRLNLKEEIYTAKGGVEQIIHKFVNYLLEEGKIDGVIISGGDNWKPISLIVEKPNENSELPLSTYTIGTLDALTEAGRQGLEKVAVVSLPCQIGGLRKLEYLPYVASNVKELIAGSDTEKIPKIEYFIGEFCREKYDYKTLDTILKDYNLNVNDVERFTLNDGNLLVETDDDFQVINIKQLAMESGCKLCKDFDAELADVSIGFTGSNRGESTIIIRSEKGKEIENVIELDKNVDLNSLKQRRAQKVERFNKEIVGRKLEGKFNTYYWNSDYPGVIKGKNDTYIIRTRGKSNGIYSIKYTKDLIDICEKYHCEIKLTARSSFEIHGVRPIDVDNIIKELHSHQIELGSSGNVIRTVMSCPGVEGCNSGLINTSSIAEKIEDKFGQIPTPSKFEIAISGCPNNCVRSQINDFGIQGVEYPICDIEKCNNCERCVDFCPVNAIHGRRGSSFTNYDACIGCGKCIRICPSNAREVKESGYITYIGGKSGREIIPGITSKVYSEEEILNKLDAVIKVYIKFADAYKKERLANTIKRIGMDEFLKEVNKLP